MTDFVLHLVKSLGLLVLLAVAVAWLRPLTDTLAVRALRDLAIGTLFGLVATVVMLDPIVSPQGATFDPRGGPAILAGIFGGPVGAVAAAAIGAGARYVVVGGPVALGGAAGFGLYAVAGVLVGAAARRWRLSRGLWLFLGAGLLGTLFVLPAFFVSADWATGTAILAQAWPMLLGANLISAVVVGLIVERGQHLARLNENLQAREVEAKKLALVASETTNAVIITEPGGTIEWVNKGFERLVGYTQDEVVGLKPGDFLQGPDTDPATVRHMHDCLARGIGFHVEVLNYAKDGRAYWLAIDCQAIREQGRLAGFMAIESDITERKLLQKRLLRAEQVGNMGHWTLDPHTGEIVWSAQSYRIFGIDPSEPIPPLDRAIQRYHPDDRDEVARIVGDAAARGEGFQFRKRLIADGRVKWVDVKGECERAPDGTAHLFFGVIQDTTHLVEALNQAEAGEAKLRTLMDAVPASVSYLDAGGRYRFSNRTHCELLGRSPGDLIGRHWAGLWPHPPGEETEQAVTRALAGEMVVKPEDWPGSAGEQGRVRQFNLTLVPDLAGDGTVRGVFSIAFDVTDYREREAALRRARDEATMASKVKSEFLATMSHELRTPLNAINGYAEMMAEEMFGPLGNPRYRDYARDIHGSGVYLRELIEGVLELSSMEARPAGLAAERVDAAKLARDAVALVDGTARTKRIALEAPAKTAAIPAIGDPRALKQVLVNLVENAVKFTPAGGRVRVSVEPGPDGVRLGVSDTGRGIPQHQIDRVTEPFYRVRPANQAHIAAEPGTGIGLALVQRYIKLMNGRLDLDSVEGVGTTVTVTLPVPAAEPVPEPGAEPEASTTAAM